MTTCHRCKCHDLAYTRCPDCGAEYCPHVWPACPRASWRAHGSPADRAAPTPDPVIDLDLWADPARHARTVTADRDQAGDWQWRAICGCGWRSFPIPEARYAHRERCPVLDALQERQERMTP